MKKQHSDVAEGNIPQGFQSFQTLEHLHVLLYGPPKVGKTLLAATFPPPVCFIDTDNGMLSVLTHGKTAERAKAGQIFWTTVQKDASYADLCDEIAKVGELATAQKVRTVVFDSATTLGDIILKHILLASKKRPGQIATFDDWESQKNVLLSIFHQAFAWPCHVVIICHEQTEKDDLLGSIHVLPMLTGNLRHKLPIHFDEVWHLMIDKNEEGKKEFWVETAGDQKLLGCGSRLGLTETIEADFDAIMEVFLEKGGDAELHKVLTAPRVVQSTTGAESTN